MVPGTSVGLLQHLKTRISYYAVSPSNYRSTAITTGRLHRRIKHSGDDGITALFKLALQFDHRSPHRRGQTARFQILNAFYTYKWRQYNSQTYTARTYTHSLTTGLGYSPTNAHRTAKVKQLHFKPQCVLDSRKSCCTVRHTLLVHHGHSPTTSLGSSPTIAHRTQEVDQVHFKASMRSRLEEASIHSQTSTLYRGLTVLPMHVLAVRVYVRYARVGR